MSKKVECECLETAGMLNFTYPGKPIGDCCVCHGTGKVKVLAYKAPSNGRVPLSKSGKEVKIICRRCYRTQRVSMGSASQQASSCPRHLEVRV